MRLAAGPTERAATQALWLWAGFIVVSPFLRKFSVLETLGVLAPLEELLFLPVLPLAYVGVRRLVADAWGRGFLAFYVVFVALGTASWLLAPRPAPPQAMVLQVVMDAKLPLVVAAFVGLSNPTWLASRIVWFMKGMLVLSMPLTLLQFVAPDLYSAIFDASAHHRLFTISSGLALPRSAGAFRHPSQLALVAAIVAAFEWFRWLQERKPRSITWVLLGGALLVSTFQRQEAVAFLFALPAVMLYQYRSRAVGEKLLITALGVVLIATLALPVSGSVASYVTRAASTLGLSDPSASQAARVVFYLVGAQMASAHFPLGVGFGAFGGIGARAFGSPVYEDLGFSRFWWYRDRVFLTDTYWPHVYAEAGWIGCFALLVAIGCLLGMLAKAAVRSHRSEHSGSTATALFSAVFLFAVSLTSTVLTSMLALMACSMLIGSTGGHPTRGELLARRLLVRDRTP